MLGVSFCSESKYFMIGLYRQTAGSASVMSSAWREQWHFFGGNDSLSEDNSCFNSSQSTVLNGDRFGGVPLVLLLNFSVFVVWLSVCPRQHLKTSSPLFFSVVVIRQRRQLLKWLCFLSVTLKIAQLFFLYYAILNRH